MVQYKIFIGSDNITKELNISKIEDTASKFFNAFTLEKATGYWNGTPEHMATVTVLSTAKDLDQERTNVYKLAKELKESLNQDSVLVTLQEVNANFI